MAIPLSSSRRGRTATFRPWIERLEDRQLLACSVFETTEFRGLYDDTNDAVIFRQLNLIGDETSNIVRIVDDGTDMPGNISITCDGFEYSSLTAINEIRVSTRGARDVVTYELTGDLRGRVALLRTAQVEFALPTSVFVDLGDDADRFVWTSAGTVFARLTEVVLDANGQPVPLLNTDGTPVLDANGNVVFRTEDRSGNMNIQITGGNGRDNLVVQAQGVHISDNARLGFNLNGNANNDVVRVNYQGDVQGDVDSSLVEGRLGFTLNGHTDKNRLNVNYRGEVDGTVLIGANGGDSTDTIVVTASARLGSSGFISAAVIGGADNDRLALFVRNENRFDTATVEGLIDGGFDNDIIRRNSNVLVTDA